MQAKQNKIQIGLEQIANINNLTSNIDPKLLICSVCFCININVKQCNNKLCSKLFCGKCYDELSSNKQSNTNNILCPYCRTVLVFSKVNENLVNTISSLKYFCIEHISCNKQYTYDEFSLIHLNKLPNTSYECSVCENNELNWKQILKCVQCLNYCCDNINNKCVDKCFKCNNPVCKNCRKGKEGSFLCDSCFITCYNCPDKEAEVVCNLCNKVLCMECASDVCLSCNRYFCKDLKCHYNKEKPFCKICSSISQYEMYNTCVHLEIIDCRKCYNKCKVCTSIVLNNNNKQCKDCKINICTYSCSLKCRSCSEYICYSCLFKCFVCKKPTCSTCIRFCNQCGISNTLWLSCKRCNTDTLRTCAFESCDTLLCLNCWNICNSCNNIYCQEHSTKCDKCEDTICNTHSHSCSQCESAKGENFSKYKTCLAKCTFKCNFCSNAMNAFCTKEIHDNNNSNVSLQECQHLVCNKCQIKCAKCTNIVQKCPQCINNYYFSSCYYCDNYLCQDCGNICTKCESTYCSFNHKCQNCNKQINTSLFCIKCFDSNRAKCIICKNKLQKPCKTCISIFLCSFSCYYHYKTKVNLIQKETSDLNNTSLYKVNPYCPNGICEMFFCENHFWLNNKLLEQLETFDRLFQNNSV